MPAGFADRNWRVSRGHSSSRGSVAALRKVSVHAYEDPGRPEGGHAILLLHGLTKAPPELSFRLKPSDASVITDASGWPAGELRPLASRVTPEGLELQLGPEITENEFLLPGTLLEIEVANADARGEFLWPNIAPMLRPKRRTVIVNSPRRKGPGGDPAKDNAPAPDTKRGPGAEAPERRPALRGAGRLHAPRDRDGGAGLAPAPRRHLRDHRALAVGPGASGRVVTPRSG